MANNRMLLLHQPTGKHIAIAKRMAVGWYTSLDNARLMAFFAEVEAASEYADQDNFALVLEDAEGAPAAMEVLQYSEEPDRLRVKPRQR